MIAAVNEISPYVLRFKSGSKNGNLKRGGKKTCAFEKL